VSVKTVSVKTVSVKTVSVKAVSVKAGHLGVGRPVIADEGGPTFKSYWDLSQFSDSCSCSPTRRRLTTTRSTCCR
jgi:hypothetical protein